MKESSRRRKAKYSEEFKRDAVALAEESSVSAVAKELGISYSLLFRWKQKQHALLSQPNEESLSHKDLLIAYKKIREELKEQQEDLIKHRRAHKELIETHKKMEKDNRALKVVNSVLKKTTAIFSQDQLEKDIT